MFDESLDHFQNTVDDYTTYGRVHLDATMRDEKIPLFNRWCTFMRYGRKFYPASRFIIKKSPTRFYIEKNGMPERYTCLLFCDYFEEYYLESGTQEPDKGLLEEILENFNQIPEDVVRDVISSGLSGFTVDW